VLRLGLGVVSACKEEGPLVGATRECLFRRRVACSCRVLTHKQVRKEGKREGGREGGRARRGARGSVCAVDG